MDKDDLYVEALTISELKSIIKDIVKETVQEELTKLKFNKVEYVPVYPVPAVPQYPWQQTVWCDTKSTSTPGSLGYKHLDEKG